MRGVLLSIIAGETAPIAGHQKQDDEL